MDKYNCIKKLKIKGKNLLFNVNDIVVIVNKNDKYYTISDINYSKGLIINSDDFNIYFKLITD